jgi:hypothetical protein
MGGGIAAVWMLSFYPGIGMRQFDITTPGERLMNAVVGNDVGVLTRILWGVSVPVSIGALLLVEHVAHRRHNRDK